MLIRTTVNGVEHAVDVAPETSLLTLLRDELGLVGTKNACEEGECGSCSVWLDGELVCSCLVPAVQADGREVRTVEALANGESFTRCRRRSSPRAPSSAASARPGCSSPRPTCSSATPPRTTRRSRGARRQPLPLHRLPQDRRRGALASGRRHPDGRRRGGVGESARRVDGVPKVTGHSPTAATFAPTGCSGGHRAEPARVGAHPLDRRRRSAEAPGVPRC